MSTGQTSLGPGGGPVSGVVQATAGEGVWSILRVVSTRERPADRGRRRAVDDLRTLGRDERSARLGSGLSLRAVAAASGTSHQQLLRFERGLTEHLSLQ